LLTDVTPVATLSVSTSVLCCRILLYLERVVHISYCRSVCHVFFGCLLPQWSWSVHCSACLAM